MAFEDLITKINLFLNEAVKQPGDAHEQFEQLHLELNQLRATGQPVPDDLARLEQRLIDEFTVDGRPRPAAKEH